MVENLFHKLKKNRNKSLNIQSNNPIKNKEESEEYQNFKQKIEEYTLKSMTDGNYYLFASDFAKKILNASQVNQGAYDYMTDLIESWDKDILIPYEIGKMIEDYVNNPNYFIGIHRTPIYQDEEHIHEDKRLNSIFNQGLRNYGDLSSGAYRKEYIEVNKTVSPIDSMLTAVTCLKTSYKGSNGGVLVTIPSKFVDKDGYIIPGHEQDVYIDTGECYSIKPEFLLGYVSCNSKNNKIEYYSQAGFVHKNAVK